MTDLAPMRDEQDASEQRPSLTLPVILGLALLPLGKLLPPALATPVALAAAGLAGALAESSPLLAGVVVGVPLAIGAVLVAFFDSLGLGALVIVAAGCYLGLSALAGAAGAMAGQSWRDRTSEDPEARARARRGVIILVAAALFFGAPNAALSISDDRAHDRAKTLQRRLVAVTRASVPVDAAALTFEDEPDHPIRQAVPEVQIIPTSQGANLQAEARWGLSARCVLVQVKGTAITSRIANDGCGALVGG